MTNREKYGDMIIETAMSSCIIGVTKNGEVRPCADMNMCRDCVFDNADDADCTAEAKRWLDEEFIDTSWNDVKSGTRIWVSDNNWQWVKREFASYVNGSVYVYSPSGKDMLYSYKYARIDDPNNEESFYN